MNYQITELNQESISGLGFFPSHGRELDLYQFMGNPKCLSLPLKDLSESMEKMESQTLLLTLLSVKVNTELRSWVMWVEGRPLSARRWSPLWPELSF